MASSRDEADHAWSSLQNDFRRGVDNVAYNAHANMNPVRPKPMSISFPWEDHHWKGFFGETEVLTMESMFIPLVGWNESVPYNKTSPLVLATKAPVTETPTVPKRPMAWNPQKPRLQWPTQVSESEKDQAVAVKFMWVLESIGPEHSELARQMHSVDQGIANQMVRDCLHGAPSILTSI